MKKIKALRRQELAAARESKKLEHKQELNKKRQRRWRKKRKKEMGKAVFNRQEADRKKDARRKRQRVVEDAKELCEQMYADLGLMEEPAVPLEPTLNWEEDEPLVIPWRTKRRAPDTPPASTPTTPPASPFPWDSPELLD